MKRDGLFPGIRFGFYSTYYLLDFEHLKMEGEETRTGEVVHVVVAEEKATVDMGPRKDSRGIDVLRH